MAEQSQVATGQRWRVEHEGETLGELLVSRVRMGYVTGWPVTTDGFEMPGSHRLDEDTVCWPGFETGVDLRALGTLVGQELTEDQMESAWQEFLSWSDRVPVIPATLTPEQSAWLGASVARWERICYLYEEDWE